MSFKIVPSKLCMHIHCTSSTAQGGGEVSRIESLEEMLVVVNNGWQSESTDEPKGGWGWSCVFGVVASVAVVTWSVTSPTTAVVVVAVVVLAVVVFSVVQWSW